jgi:hypothetical protein
MSDTVVVTETVTGTIEILTAGPMGPRGHPGSAIGSGDSDGDFLRWNAVTLEWEVKSEPLELAGVILTPQEAAILEQEGAFYYSSTDKTLKLCIGED